MLWADKGDMLYQLKRNKRWSASSFNGTWPFSTSILQMMGRLGPLDQQSGLQAGMNIATTAPQIRMEQGSLLLNPSVHHENSSQFRRGYYGALKKSYVRQHLLLKHNEFRHRPFTCSFCPMRFALKHHLSTHVRIHTGEKPYKCERCSLRFANYGSLYNHLRKKKKCSAQG